MARSAITAILLATASASPLITARNAATTNTTTVYDFKSVPVTKDIQYVPCFENFTCTNIEVPLDYDNLTAGTTSIAFIKHTALKQPAKGDIIYNPGGPGNSAAQIFVGAQFATLPRLLGDEYNIVGMDPRGVNNSGPNLDCFKGHPEVRNFYDKQYDHAVEPRSQASLRSYFAAAGAFGTWCSRSLGDEARYANTPAVSRDMLHYAELLAESKGQPKEQAKVDFFGASYGSVLGDTFAQLFPDRVGKFIIDANIDGDDYYRGNWSESLIQTDKAVHTFIEMCYDAGPTCAFFRNDSSSAAIKTRLDDILADLEKCPIPVTDASVVQYPVLATHKDLRGELLTSMYNSISSWGRLSLVLSDLEQRNGTSLAERVKKGLFNPPVEDKYSTIQPKLIIACNDQMGRYNVSSVEQLEELYDFSRGRSIYAGDVWPQIIVPQCRNLRFMPPKSQQFHGE